MVDTPETQRRARSHRKLLRLWPIGVVAVVALAIGMILPNSFPTMFGTEEQSDHSLVVHSLERSEEIVLMGLGIQGITEERVSRTVFGRSVPGSGRALFLQYNFQAKLGINGEDVEIEQRGEDGLHITIPEFIFIGHDDITFKTALEDNGALSWVSPDIDEPDVINQILNDQNVDVHVNANRDLLEDQAEAFYTGIVTAVDPNIRVTFEFPEADPTR
ncbi:hypothetical protein [Flaviflexus huanghaiensis]|uniref:hypothetical protein n=1 Tax=Flaviflexus huanghaiensis TaxID=1111473 RepID=UPI0015FDA3B2|nr:hypothetical protein [Flaviflexus huanghaiensis]